MMKIVELFGGNHTKDKEPFLGKYIRRHHAPDQIIGDKYDGTMKRRKLKGTCLLIEFEPRSVKDAVENEYWNKDSNQANIFFKIFSSMNAHDNII